MIRAKASANPHRWAATYAKKNAVKSRNPTATMRVHGLLSIIRHAIESAGMIAAVMIPFLDNKASCLIAAVGPYEIDDEFP
jgi:hypothetical protein